MTWTSAVDHSGRPFAVAAPEGDAGGIEPVRIGALAGRRERPRLLVHVDGNGYGARELVWALKEAARRDATVLAVTSVDSAAPEHRRAAALAALEAHVMRAVGETGVHGRARAALMDPHVLEAVAGTARGGELVVVRPHGKSVLRAAVPRPAVRRVLQAG